MILRRFTFIPLVTSTVLRECAVYLTLAVPVTSLVTQNSFTSFGKSFFSRLNVSLCAFLYLNYLSKSIYVIELKFVIKIEGKNILCRILIYPSVRLYAITLKLLDRF